MNHNRVLKSIFADTLQREGRTIHGYYNNKRYKAIFRRNKDNNSVKDHITIFYPVKHSVTQGQLLRYGSEMFLTLNQETVENDVYLRSSCLRCNTNLSVVVDGTEVVVPCFAADATDVNPDSSSAMSVVDNGIKLMTEANLYSEAVKINDYTEILGGAYTVSNLVVKDGMALIYLRRTQKRPRDFYSLLTDAEKTYRLGDSATFSAIACVGDVPVRNATITWASGSDTVSIDRIGNTTFTGTGEAEVTAHWTEHDVSATLTFEIVDKDIFTFEITGAEEILCNSSQTYSATFHRNNVSETISPTWSLDFGGDISLNPKITLTDNGDGTATVSVANNPAIVGKSFAIVVADDSGMYLARQSVKIVKYTGGW